MRHLWAVVVNDLSCGRLDCNSSGMYVPHDAAEECVVGVMDNVFVDVECVPCAANPVRCFLDDAMEPELGILFRLSIGPPVMADSDSCDVALAKVVRFLLFDSSITIS